MGTSFYTANKDMNLLQGKVIYDIEGQVKCDSSSCLMSCLLLNKTEVTSITVKINHLRNSKGYSI